MVEGGVDWLLGKRRIRAEEWVGGVSLSGES